MDFPLAEWEHFVAPVNADGDVTLITHVFTDDTNHRIYGHGPTDDNVWLNPARVPSRVLRRDTRIPMHPLEVRELIRRGATAIEEDADEKLAARIEALPAPEVRARPATLEEIPRGARLVGKRANEAGFVQTASYARGPRVNQYWRVVEISESIVIRGRHTDGRRFVAWWITKTGERGAKAGVTEWKFDGAYADVAGIWTACGTEQLASYFTNTSLIQEAS